MVAYSRAACMDLGIIFCTLLAGFGGCFVSGNPVRSTGSPPWCRPCDLDAPISGGTGVDVATVPVSVNNMIVSLMPAIGETLNFSQNLKTQIFQYRLDGSQALSNSLASLDSSYVPSDVATWTNTEQTGTVLKSQYRRLSLLLAYLEITEKDLRGDNSRNFLQPFVHNLQRKILVVLCKYSVIIQSLGMRVTRHVTRNEINVSRPQNIAGFDLRDYLLARDAVNLVLAISDNHSRMLQAYQ